MQIALLKIYSFQISIQCGYLAIIRCEMCFLSEDFPSSYTGLWYQLKVKTRLHFEHLLWARQLSEMIILSYQIRRWSTEKLSNLPSVTQPISGRTRIQTQVIRLLLSCYSLFNQPTCNLNYFPIYLAQQTGHSLKAGIDLISPSI